MSNPYPSRRELRLQRERAQRAKLREAENQRWTQEVEQRNPQPVELTPEPVEEDTSSDQDDAFAPGRRASARPVDTPPDVETLDAEMSAESRRRRRADSEVTSTGMIPIISKPRDESPKPRSRREARLLEARRAAERRAELERLQREQGEVAEPKTVRRASAPQTSPAPAASPEPVTETTAPQPEESTPQEAAVEEAGVDEEFDVEITATHDFSATEITDMSGLDTIEIRRAELRAETERLTQEIIELGERNPNVIDPKLLRRQKELAEKSQELQELETAAIELGGEPEPQDKPVVSAEPASEEEPVSSGPATQDEPAAEDESDGSESAEPTTQAMPTQPADSATAPDQTDDATPAREQSENKGLRRRRRRSSEGPFITGPFEVEDEEASETETTKPVSETKPPLADFIRAPVAPEPERDPREPLEASSAHGLDTLDAKDVEAPERRLRISAAVMFAIGVIALLVAIILLTR